MAVTQQPTDLVQVGYRPIKFEFRITDVEPMVNIEVTFLLTFGAITHVLRQPPIQLIDNTGTWTSVFEVDAHGIVSRYLPPSTEQQSNIFADLDSEQQFGGDGIIDFQLQTKYFFRNTTTNLLEEEGTDDTTQQYYALCASMRHDEIPRLAGTYYAVDPALFLLRGKRTRNICPTENFSLGYITSSANDFIIVEEHLIGGGTVYGYKNWGAVGNVQYISGNMGPTAILNDTWLDGTTGLPDAGLFTMTEAATDYYEVYFGNDTPGGGPGLLYTRVSEGIRFDMVRCCGDNSLRLHWMNSLGGPDAFTFKGIRRRNAEMTGQKGEVPAKWNVIPLANGTGHNPALRGSFRHSTEAREIYEIESDWLDEEDKLRISELFYSPEVYVEIPGLTYYLPVVLRVESDAISDSTIYGVPSVFTVELPRIITQVN